MTPGKHDLALYRGDTETFQVRLWSDEDVTVTPTVPYDLTGATVEAEIRDKTAGSKIVVLETAVTLPNIIDVAMHPDMYATCPSSGIWDLQITDVAGQVLTPLAGKVKVTGDVTDSEPMAKGTR